jgi:TonB family protein
MNRHKSYFGPSLVFVAAVYFALFYWVHGFSFSKVSPLPEGSAMEWVELSEPTAGQPEPSSTPDQPVAAPEPVRELPPKVVPQVAEQPAPEPVRENVEEAPVMAAAAPVPTYEEPVPEPMITEGAPEAWTAPDSEIPVLAEEMESAQEPEETLADNEDVADVKGVEPTSQIGTLSDKDFFEPGEYREESAEPAPVVADTAASTLASKPASGSEGPSANQIPAFSNPYVDPNAPPVGRHGVLDARSLAPAAGNPPPAYPASDRLARREGVVVLLGYVLPSGRLGRVTVEQEASSAMTQESYRTFKNYRYRPGQTGWVRQTFKFTLKGAPEEIKATLRGSR